MRSSRRCSEPFRSYFSPLTLNVEVLFDADIPLARIAQNGHDILAWSQFQGHLLRSEYVGSGRNAYQEALFFRELLGR